MIYIFLQIVVYNLLFHFATLPLSTNIECDATNTNGNAFKKIVNPNNWANYTDKISSKRMDNATGPFCTSVLTENPNIFQNGNSTAALLTLFCLEYVMVPGADEQFSFYLNRNSCRDELIRKYGINGISH
eukprot:Pgem_evm1s1810